MSYYSLLDSFAFDVVNRIEEIHVVQDSLLLIRELYFDDTVIVKKGKGCTERRLHLIHPIKKKIIATFKQTGCYFDGRKQLARDEFPIWTAHDYPVRYFNNTLVEFHFASPYTPLNTTFAKYYLRNQEYLKKHKPVLNMWIYRYTF